MTAPTVPYYQQPVVTTGETWLDYRHPEWVANAHKWRYARDVYTGAVLDSDKLPNYLIRKGTGETLPAYNERVALADFTSHFGLCADALAGMLFHVEDDATRVFGDLGQPDDPTSYIGGLYRNADGHNTGYATIWKQLGIELTIVHCPWILVTVPTPGAPRITQVEPERVVDWVEDKDGIAMVKVCENVDQRTSLEDDPDAVEQYIVFTREGWQRYRKEKGADGKATAVKVGDPGRYQYEDASGRKQLPIFRAQLPLRRNVGYSLAKKNVAIFNKESERDHLLRVANFPKLIVPALDDVFNAIKKQVELGSFLLQDDPSSTKTIAFAGPPTGSVEIATKVLDQKVEQFYKTFFREYSDTAQEKTAAEIRQDVASGVGAFLQMLKAGLDDAENETLWRLEQAVFPNDRAKWHKARVERDDNFQPLNAEEEIERLRTRYLGQTTPVPVGRDAMVEVLRQIAAWDGIEFDEKAAGAAVDAHQLDAMQDLLDKLPVPKSAKAKIAVRWLITLGLADAKDEAALIAEAEKEVAAEDQMRSLLAQPPGPPKDEPAPEPKKPDPPARETRISRDGQGGYVVRRGD